MDGQFDPSPETSGLRALDERQRIPLSQDQSGFALAFGWLAATVARLMPARTVAARVQARRAEPRL
jgi:hypothetical protein